MVLSIVIVLVVAFASAPWRTSAAPSIDSAPATTASDNVVPTSIDSAPEPESRVTVRPVPTPPAVAAAPGPPPRPAPIPGKIQLIGEVRDPSGQRIVAMPAVLCYRTPTRSLTNSIVRGEFVVGGLDPGTMLGLECAVKGYRPETRRILLNRGEGEQREDFVLQPLWMVDVELRTSDGQSLIRNARTEFSPKDLQLRVSEDPPPEHWNETTAEARRARRRVYTEQQGPLPAGVFARIAPLCDPPQFLSVDTGGRVLAFARLAADVHRVTLVIPNEALDAFKSSLVCTVVDEDGSPLSGVRANVMRRGWSAAGGTSDATGRVRCGGLLSGQWMLFLNSNRRDLDSESPGSRSEGRARMVRFIDLLPGKELDLGTITLGASLHVRGRFVDADGRPIQGRSIGELAQAIEVSPYSAEDPSGSAIWSGPTQFEGKPDGTFEGTRFGRERYLLTSVRPVPVSGGNRVIRPTVLDCTQGSVDDLAVTTDRAYPVTVRPEVDEAKDFGFSILDASGTELHRHDVAEGRTWFLPSGEYRLIVGPDLGHMKEIPFKVESGPLLIPIEP